MTMWEMLQMGTWLKESWQRGIGSGSWTSMHKASLDLVFMHLLWAFPGTV